MSWANVRGAIVTSLSALTPTSRAATEYVCIDDGFPEEQAVFRGFDVRLISGPAQVGQVLNSTDWRWLTQCELVVWYPKIRSRAEMEQVISEDAVQLQQTFLQLGNHHANVEAVVPHGEGYSTPTVEYDEGGAAVLRVPLTIHHL